MGFTLWTAGTNAFKAILTSTTDPNTVSTGPGANGCDIGNAIDIGSNRSLWVFGDTFWTKSAGKTRNQDLSLIRNPVVLQTGRDLSTATIGWYVAGAAATPLDFLPPVAQQGTELWKYPLGGVFLDDRVLVVGMLSRSALGVTPASFGTFMCGSWATMLYNAGSGVPTDWPQLNLATNAGGHSNYWQGPQYCFACNPIDQGDGYVYFPAFGPAGGNRWAMARAPRAEVKAGSLANLAWWDGNASWLTPTRNSRTGSLYRRRANILSFTIDGADQIGGIHKRSDGKWQLTFITEGWVEANTGLSPPAQQPRVRVALANGPGERFGTPATAFTIPMAGDNKDFVYGAYSLPEQTWSGKGATDQAIVISRNRTNDLTLFSNSTMYWPEVYKVTGIA